jgi:hypothetical protein
MIHILRSRATPEQMQQMLESLGIYLKLAVDIEQNIPLINIRPRNNNRSMEVQDDQIREKIKEIVQNLLGDVPWQ